MERVHFDLKSYYALGRIACTGSRRANSRRDSDWLTESRLSTVKPGSFRHYIAFTIVNVRGRSFKLVRSGSEKSLIGKLTDCHDGGMRGQRRKRTPAPQASRK